MEQVTGAAVASVVVMGYLLLVEGLTAAIVLLAHFIVLQVRALRTLAVVEPKPTPAPMVESAAEPQGQTYRLGGDLKW
jgi:hypothetical protein